MHDLRAAPRWSKTAVVVVLVVFGLVLVVAIFGLWAFNSDQDARHRRERDEARMKAQDLLERVQGDIARTLSGLLVRAAGGEDSGPRIAPGVQRGRREQLRDFVAGAQHGPLVRAVFRVDLGEPGGLILWPRGGYRLILGARPTEALAAEQMRGLVRAEKLFEDARAAERSLGAAAALQLMRELARDYGLVAYVEENGPLDSEQRFPYGLAWAVEMLRTATNALTAAPASVRPQVLHDVVLRALEAAALNGPRSGLDPEFTRGKLAQLDRDLERVIEKAPADQRDLLAWEAEHFRRFRQEALARFQSGRLLGVAKRAADRGIGRYVVHDDELMPYGVVVFPAPKEEQQEVVAVLLDAQAVEARLRATLVARESQFDALGVKARLQGVTAGPDARLGPADGTVPLVGDVQLPYRLDFWQVGDPVPGDADRADVVLFWAVIALAVAGLVVGGTVLVRLLTREIRLARLKADFVSNLSHELKTPITSISLFTEMLEEGKLTEAEDQAEAFGVLGQESRRLQRIVSRMIDVARGEARRNPYDLAPGDLNRPVLEAAARLRRIVTEPGLDLSVELHPAPLHAQMDRQALDDAVTNLLSNAWKYKRGERARIVVRTAKRGRFAEIVVSDDGIGIPRGERRKVFEMFYRSEQYLTHPVAGTGLGLALVRSVIAAHRGRIDVEAGERGVGTAIRVRIPLDGRAREALAADASAAMGDGPDSAQPSGHGKVEEPAPQNEASARSRTWKPGAPS